MRTSISAYRIVRWCSFVAAALIIAASSALAQNPNPGIHPPTSMPYGVSYAEWVGNWFQWLIQIPVDENPLLDPDGRFCHVEQTGRVFFLGQTALGVPTVRSCTIQPGLSVQIFPGGTLCILGLDADTGEGLEQCVEQSLTSIAAVSADIDGAPVQEIDSYLFVSPLFTFTLPADNLLGLPAGQYQGRAGGWTLITTPLSPGQHVIHFHDEVPGPLLADTTYYLTVSAHH